jgi:hypothetical protein
MLRIRLPPLSRGEGDVLSLKLLEGKDGTRKATNIFVQNALRKPNKVAVKIVEVIEL